MSPSELETCFGCGAALPPFDGPTHRYLGASAACWDLFSKLLNGGEPPLAPAPLNALLLDAYAVQHPGTPSPQAIQSVAVHALTLYGVLELGVAPDQALWVRQRALRLRSGSRRERYRWLTPPSFAGSLTVARIVAAPTPAARAEVAGRFVTEVWSLWAQTHRSTFEGWYAEFVAAE